MANIFQPPSGTRDFYPEEMALRRFIEDAWRRVSQRHGFVEVDGPTFEYLDLYKVKSGDEIVSQLFHFESRGEDKTQFALRPEFTPTLARMIAAKANSLPRPVKWFSIPRCYRAERPQKGRLREFIQWNVDMLGGETPEAKRQFDLEVAALCLDCLREFGVANSDVNLLWNDRQLVEKLFELAGVPAERYAFAFYLLDRIAKLAPEQRAKQYADNGLTDGEKSFFEKLANKQDPLDGAFWQGTTADFATYAATIAATQEGIDRTLGHMGLPGYAKYDASIVRGLAYYTGFVFEVSDTRGQHRAIAGGGRYDRLIEMFGGPSLPAVGFGMGDVVIENLLRDLGKLPEFKGRGVAPDVFVVNALASAEESTRLIGALRTAGFNVGTSYKTTKNIGKILQEASGAKLAIILGPAEWERGVLKVKNLATREENEVPVGEMLETVRRLVRSNA
jgi:histidyl-tRNA synthetase